MTIIDVLFFKPARIIRNPEMNSNIHVAFKNRVRILQPLQYSSIHVDCRVCGGVTSTSVPQACLLTFQRVWGGGSNTFLPQSGGRSK